MRNHWILLIFSIATLSTGTGCKDQRTKKKSIILPPPLVKYVITRTITHYPTFSALGRAQPVREVVLAPERPGKLIYFEEDLGRTVESGQLIARVKAIGLWPQKRQAEARIHELEVALQKAERDLKRIRQLYKDGVVSRDELEKIELLVKSRRAQLQSAQAGLSTVRENLGSTSVLAPFSGEIVEVYQHKNNFVGAGMPLARLVDLSDVKIVVGVSEVDIPYIRVGDTVEVTAAAYPKKRWKATVHAKSDAVPKNSVSFPVEIRLKNMKTGDGSWEIKSGMTMKVWFRRNPVTGIFLPPSSVVNLKNTRFVYVLNGDTVKRTSVTIGDYYTFRDEIQLIQVFGLSDGLKVLSTGVPRVKDGMKVRAVRTTLFGQDSDSHASKKAAKKHVPSQKDSRAGKQAAAGTTDSREGTR